MSEPCAHERDYTTTQAMKSYVAASVLAGDAAIERDALKVEVERLNVKVNLARLQRDYETQRREDVAAEYQKAGKSWDTTRARLSSDLADVVPALHEARATLAKIAAIVADPAAALVAERVRAALEPTDQPKGTKP